MVKPNRLDVMRAIVKMCILTGTYLTFSETRNVYLKNIKQCLMWMWMWNWIVSVPDHCLFTCFSSYSGSCGPNRGRFREEPGGRDGTMATTGED